MRLVIAGPGALGSLFAARITLFLAVEGNHYDWDGSSLWLLDHRADRARLLSREKLLFEDGAQKKYCTVQATADPYAIGGCDVLLLCVKSPAVPQAIEHANPLLTGDTLLIALQNGIAHLHHIEASTAIPAAGITSEGATLAKAGHVLHGGSGVTRIGLLDHQRQNSGGKIEKTVQLLNQAGLPAEKTDQPLQHIWAKLFVNVGINALTAIHNRKNGELLLSATIREVMTQAVREAELIALALNVPVKEDPVEKTLQVCSATGNNISSMLQDVRNQRRTEIDAINGAVVAQGRRLGIPTPVNSDLVSRIKALEARYIPTTH